MAIALLSISHPWIETTDLSKQILIKIIDHAEIIEISSIFKRKNPTGSEFDANIEFCISISTTKDSLELSRVLKNISLGISKKRADSNVTINLLLYESEVCLTPELTLPHPVLQYDNFILNVASELWSRYEHPIFKKTIQELAEVRQSDIFAEFIQQGQNLFD